MPLPVCHETTLNGPLAAHTGPCSCTGLSTEAVDVLNEVRDGDTTRLHAMFDADPLPASPPAVAASTGTSEDVEALAALIHARGWPDPVRLPLEPDACEVCEGSIRTARAVLASDWLAAREAAARAEERERIAQADRCGGCKGQGSHRRHCPRHPNYHPWIPLADRAESIGDSIGEPGLANQAWALAAAIRDEMPNHPYRPVRHREAR